MPRKRTTTDEAYYKAFPTRLRELMNRTTQQELAAVIGKTRQSVSYYCDGSASPDWETLVKIADYFHVSMDYLLGRTQVRTMDTDTQEICERTGLTEENVWYLLNWHKKMYHLEKEEGEEEQDRHSLINDVISIVGGESRIDLLVSFQKMLHSREHYLKPKDLSETIEVNGEPFPVPSSLRKTIIAEHNGFIYMEPEESVSFFLSQIVDIFKTELRKKYLYSLTEKEDTTNGND